MIQLTSYELPDEVHDSIRSHFWNIGTYVERVSERVNACISWKMGVSAFWKHKKYHTLVGKESGMRAALLDKKIEITDEMREAAMIHRNGTSLSRENTSFIVSGDEAIYFLLWNLCNTYYWEQNPIGE